MGVTYERKNKIAYLTIEGRTDYNLFAPDTVYLPLYDAFIQYEQDEEAWCAILTAVGTKAFSAGGDLKAYEKLDKGYQREVGQMQAGKVVERSLDTLYHGKMKMTKPMIFAVNGLCVGAPFDLMMHYADMTISVPHARFGHPAIKHAIGAGVGGPQRQRFLPWPIAMELCLTGGLIDADTAFRHGFINRIVPPEELMTAATALAEDIVAMPPLHIRTVKAIMLADRANSLAFSTHVADLTHGAIPYDHPDTREGIVAFVEHRKAQYTGKKMGTPKVAGVLE